jgi:hypothetical protein
MHRNRPFLTGTLTALAFGCAVPVVAHPARVPAVQHVQGANRAYDPQNQARQAVRAGSARRLFEIERRVLPTMRGMQYLGPEYDYEAMAYRLKFIRNGRVSYVDVDARTGQVMGRSR